MASCAVLQRSLPDIGLLQSVERFSCCSCQVLHHAFVFGGDVLCHLFSWRLLYVTVEGLWALGLDGSLVDKEMIEASVSFLPVQCGACMMCRNWRRRPHGTSSRLLFFHEAPCWTCLDPTAREPQGSSSRFSLRRAVTLPGAHGSGGRVWRFRDDVRETQPCSRAGGAPSERKARSDLYNVQRLCCESRSSVP